MFCPMMANGIALTWGATYRKRTGQLIISAATKNPLPLGMGSVKYGNGNDGTDFDWMVNGRLCEFGWGVEDGSVWAFKCFIYSDGSAEIYCYPNGEMRPVETIEKQLFTAKEAERLMLIMQKSCDMQELWDPSLCDIIWKGAE